MGNKRPTPLHEVTIDAANQTLGRLASKVAALLRGKSLVTYDPSQLPEVGVIVTNAAKLRFTGMKLKGKIYHRFSGYPGGIRSESLGLRFEKNPAELVRSCVKHMLPKNRLQAKLITYLTVYTGDKR